MAVAIALADDSVIVREGVARVLAAQPGIEVVVSCGDLPSLLEAVESERPDVVVTDIRMPPTSTDEGIRAAVLLREQHPDIGVVVLSNYAEPAYAMALLESGSEGRAYLLKERIQRPRATGGGDRVGRRRRLRTGLQDRRAARRREGARRALAAGRADRPRTRGPRGDRQGQEQRGDRRHPRAHQEGRREAHQLDLPQLNLPYAEDVRSASRPPCSFSPTQTSCPAPD